METETIVVVPGSPAKSIGSGDAYRLLKAFGISLVGFAGSFGTTAVVPVVAQSGACGAFLASLIGFLCAAAVTWSTKTSVTVQIVPAEVFRVARLDP